VPVYLSTALAKDGHLGKGLFAGMNRFEYPFKDRYATVSGVRLHYLDDGEGPVIWMMHGMPTWSYLISQDDSTTGCRRLPMLCS
jgi:hypothetical protein